MDPSCAACGKRVYMNERITVSATVTMHKLCFKCCECKATLRLGNFASMQGVYYCKPHYTQLFRLKGNYDEGFGHEQHKTKWTGGGAGAEAPHRPPSDAPATATASRQAAAAKRRSAPPLASSRTPPATSIPASLDQGDETDDPTNLPVASRASIFGAKVSTTKRHSTANIEGDIPVRPKETTASEPAQSHLQPLRRTLKPAINTTELPTPTSTLASSSSSSSSSSTAHTSAPRASAESFSFESAVCNWASAVSGRPITPQSCAGAFADGTYLCTLVNCLAKGTIDSRALSTGRSSSAALGNATLGITSASSIGCDTSSIDALALVEATPGVALELLGRLASSFLSNRMTPRYVNDGESAANVSCCVCQEEPYGKYFERDGKSFCGECMGKKETIAMLLGGTEVKAVSAKRPQAMRPASTSTAMLSAGVPTGGRVVVVTDPKTGKKVRLGADGKPAVSSTVPLPSPALSASTKTKVVAPVARSIASAAADAALEPGADKGTARRVSISPQVSIDSGRELDASELKVIIPSQRSPAGWRSALKTTSAERIAIPSREAEDDEAEREEEAKRRRAERFAKRESSSAPGLPTVERTSRSHSRESDDSTDVGPLDRKKLAEARKLLPEDEAAEIRAQLLAKRQARRQEAARRSSLEGNDDAHANNKEAFISIPVSSTDAPATAPRSLPPPTTTPSSTTTAATTIATTTTTPTKTDAAKKPRGIRRPTRVVAPTPLLNSEAEVNIKRESVEDGEEVTERAREEERLRLKEEEEQAAEAERIRLEGEEAERIRLEEEEEAERIRLEEEEEAERIRLEEEEEAERIRLEDEEAERIRLEDEEAERIALEEEEMEIKRLEEEAAERMDEEAEQIGPEEEEEEEEEEVERKRLEEEEAERMDEEEERMEEEEDRERVRQEEEEAEQMRQEEEEAERMRLDEEAERIKLEEEESRLRREEEESERLRVAEEDAKRLLLEDTAGSTEAPMVKSPKKTTAPKAIRRPNRNSARPTSSSVVVATTLAQASTDEPVQPQFARLVGSGRAEEVFVRFQQQDVVVTAPATEPVASPSSPPSPVVTQGTRLVRKPRKQSLESDSGTRAELLLHPDADEPLWDDEEGKTEMRDLLRNIKKKEAEAEEAAEESCRAVSTESEPWHVDGTRLGVYAPSPSESPLPTASASDPHASFDLQSATMDELEERMIQLDAHREMLSGLLNEVLAIQDDERTRDVRERSDLFTARWIQLQGARSDTFNEISRRELAMDGPAAAASAQRRASLRRGDSVMSVKVQRSATSNNLSSTPLVEEEEESRCTLM